MSGPMVEQTFVARATTYGSWFGLVVGVAVGCQSGTNCAAVAGAGVGFVAGRIFFRGAAVLIWCLLSAGPTPDADDYDDAPFPPVP